MGSCPSCWCCTWCQVGLTTTQIGLLLTFTLIGDTVISLWLTTSADRIGRRRMLLVGAGLMVFAGVLFALTNDLVLLVLAATIGVISPSGNEVGPFLSIEQAALTQSVPGQQRTQVFAWYNLVGSFATALGALCGGGLAQILQGAGVTPLASYRVIVLGYAAMGLLLGALFTRLSPAVEAPAADAALASPIGINSPGLASLAQRRAETRGVVFAGCFRRRVCGAEHRGLLVPHSLRRGAGGVGGIFFGANLLAGLSALSAARVAARIGLINTMVFTHIPSNILLMLVPLMPSLPLGDRRPAAAL